MKTTNPPFWIAGFLRSYFYWRARKTRRRENERLMSLESAMETVAIELAKSKVKNNIEHRTVFNLSLFVLTIEYDMSVIKFMIPFELNGWNQRFLGRQLAVLMYESTNDLLRILGKELDPVTVKLSTNSDLQTDLNELRKQLNQFKKAHLSQLKTIRNFSAAHRDKDAFEQLVVIQNLDVNDLLDMAAQFMTPISSLTPWCSKVMKHLTKI